MAMIGTPINFLYLLERMSEPLGYGLRGGPDSNTMVYFYYDDRMMETMVQSDSMKQTLQMIRSKMNTMRGQHPIQMVPVPSLPEKMPNLDLINFLCPKSGTFCYFLPAHKKAFSILKEVFMRPANQNELFRMACACRDHPMVNCQLFVYALSSCLVSRTDTRHIKIPGHYEIMPSTYCGTDVVRAAHKLAHMPEMSGDNKPKRHSVMIDHNSAGKGADPEQKVWYFREDILVNSHHFHWHVVFPTCSPKDPTKPGHRDRRGELFYYMHHSMIARYDAERLCNGLSRVRSFNFKKLTLEEGYFSGLSSENSSQQWSTRQANTPLVDIRTPMFQIKIEELERWRDRIFESIDLGYYVQKDPQTGKESRVQLDEFKGIDVLGDMVESSETLTPHSQYYGAIGFHNMGHVLIAHSHDPIADHKSEPGVMGDVAGAMRDPAFYRWHKYIDTVFDYYKTTLGPYPLHNDGKSKFPLNWPNVEVVPNSFRVKALDSQNINVLKTFWQMKDVDLSRGLDFRRDVTTEGIRKTSVNGLFTHLNHAPFDYFLKINNKTGKSALATIRIFMAPKYNENGETFMMEEQRLLFFEMDKVSKKLNPGPNDIIISSKDSSVTLRNEQGSSFKFIEKLYKEAKNVQDIVNESQCSCGWPQHLLLPRGAPGGVDYDLFVIVTDGSQDMITQTKGCNSAFSFCGVLDRKYPDARPMGYPFDRIPYSVQNPTNMLLTESCYADQVPVSTLEMYSAGIKNSATTKVTIVHENFLKADEAQMREQITTPDGACVRVTDIYPMRPDKNNSGNNGVPGRNPRPTGGSQNRWPDAPSRPNAERIKFDHEQWGGVGRRSREQDDDWEHLGGDYF